MLFALLGDVRGSSRALRQLRALRALGLTVEVLTLGPPLTGGLGEGLPLDGRLRARVLPTPSGRGPRFFWDAHRRFRAAALAAPAAVYHASDLHVLPALAAAARARGARLAYDAREYYAGLDAAHGRPWVGAAWGAVERRFAPRADLVLTVNDAIADRLAASLGITRPSVLRNVSAASGVPERSGREGRRERLGVAPDRPIVLYQGLFRPGRGLEHLVAAMAAVPEADLVLIGEGSEEEGLRAQASRLGGRVHFVPFTPPDELPALTAEADLGAIPALPLTESMRMGLPNKLFEYAAAGLPVLAGAGIEPLAALVARYGAGPVVDPRDHGALAAAVRTALFDADARARWRAGVARLHADSSWERERERFVAAYAPLLA